MNEITDLTLAELSAAIQEGRLSPLDITESYLQRISALDRRINSYITVTDETAREAARASVARLRDGRALSPLDGVPVAIKDLLDVAGVPTTNGMEGYRHNLAAQDAEIVRRLKAAGAVLLGKLNMHESAIYITNDNPHYGRCHNPWNLDYIPGGSSGGAGAAVAAGLCAMAIGTDNLGSIRFPASFCGVAGFKPTFGLVSTRGLMPFSWSTVHIGPLARGVDGLALSMAVLAGYDPDCLDSQQPPQPLDFGLQRQATINGLRVGVVGGTEIPVLEDEVTRAFEAAQRTLSKLGATLQPVHFDDLDAAVMHCYRIFAAEGAVSHAGLSAGQRALLGEDLRKMLDYGTNLPAGDLAKALRYRDGLRHRLQHIFQSVDVLLTPTSPVAPYPFTTPTPDRYVAAYTALADLGGIPALTVPMGYNAQGLPLGLQVMGALFQDPLVLRVGKAYEQATDWHTRRPALP